MNGINFIVRLFFYLTEGIFFVQATKMLITGLFGYEDKADPVQRRITKGAAAVYAGTAALLNTFQGNSLDEDKVLNGFLLLFLWGFWIIKLQEKKIKRVFIVTAAMNLMLVFLEIFFCIFSAAAKIAQFSVLLGRVMEIPAYLLLLFLIRKICQMAEKRKKGAMPFFLIVTIFLAELLVDSALAAIDPEGHNGQGEPIVSVRLIYSYSGEYLEEWQRVLTFLAVLLVLVTVLVLVIREAEVLYFQRQSMANESFLEAQKAHYEALKESNREIRKLRHDMKNHIYVMQELSRRKEYAELLDYLSQLEGDIERADHVAVHVGNEIADAILSEKKSEAGKLGIQMDIGGELSGVEFSASDICTILGNLTDNCIEAVKDLEEEKRKVEIRFKRSENFLLICAINPFAGQIRFDGDLIESTKKDKRNHGFGLLSIRTAAAKYQGECVITAKDGIFRVEIMVPTESGQGTIPVKNC